MNNLIRTILLFIFISNSVFAGDCSSQAKEIAKMNLDQVARQIGHNSSDVNEQASFVRAEKVKIDADLYETLATYAIGGSIYKGNYTITATLDESCAVRSVSIHDDSTL